VALTRRAELEALSRAVHAVTQQRSVRDVLQMVVASACELIGARYGALGIPDEEGRFAEFYAVGISDEEWERIGPLPRTHGLLGAMLREARPQRIPDVRSDPRFGWWPAAHPILTDFIGVPIVDDHEVVGAIYLANSDDQQGFSDDDEALLVLLAGHAAVALANARLNERSRELALVEERTRLARDLHDAVSQKLFSLRLTADAAATLISADPVRAATELSRVQRLAREASAELRAVLAELRPPALSEDGLVAALHKHVETLRRAHQVALTLEATTTCAVPSDVEDTIFRVAQEALHNALRHADPNVITVRLETCGDAVVLEVRDDGRGFDATASEAVAARRLGLASMRERAVRLGGTLVVRSEPGAGTVVRVEVPLGAAVHQVAPIL
jgi:signal transduction histidine kinase